MRWLVVPVFLLLGFPTSAETPAIVDSEKAEATEESAREEESRIVSALRSSKDEYGIPVELYSMDAKLNRLKAAVKTAESDSLLYAITGGICVGGGILLGSAVPELVWAPYGNETSVPYGYMLAGVGGILLVMDLFILPSIEPNRAKLKETFESTYRKYLE